MMVILIYLLILILLLKGASVLWSFSSRKKKTIKEMAMLHTSENRKRCMRLQKAVSSIAWLARAKQDAQRTKNLSKKNSTDACSYFAKEYSFLALTEHMGEIFFSNLATLNIFSSVL